jgi:hypothetical protein
VEEPPFGGSSVLKRQFFNRRHGKPNVRATMPDEQQRRCVIRRKGFWLRGQDLNL